MRLLIIPILLVAFSANAQLGSVSNPLAGTWTARDQGQTMSLVLNSNGTGVLDGERLNYKAQDGTLIVTVASEQTTNTYNYTLNGNTLVVSGGDLDEAIRFTRVVLDKQNTEPPPVNNSLIGAWSGNGEDMEFRSDGTCLYAGNSFRYVAENGQLKLSMPDGLVVIPYTLRNGNLVINVDGNDYTYNRLPPAQLRNKQNTAANAGTKNVPQELAGKWCWVDVTNTNSGGSSSENCITLNADGTYEFHMERSMSATNQGLYAGTNSSQSDRGTWWVQGQRIYYNSESRGQGSYSLKKVNHPKNVNDPMIVLDGQPFVTQYQKAPWR